MAVTTSCRRNRKHRRRKQSKEMYSQLNLPDRGGRRRLGPGFREATSVARGWSDREQRVRFHKAGSTERGGSSSFQCFQRPPLALGWGRTCACASGLWGGVGVSPSGLGWGSLRRECHFRLVFLLRAIARSGPLSVVPCTEPSRPVLGARAHAHTHVPRRNNRVVTEVWLFRLAGSCITS